MKRLKVLLLMLIVVLTLTITACKKDKGDDVLDDTEINIYLWSADGATPKGFDQVVKHFNDNYGKDLGLTVNFSFDTQDDYKTKLNLNIAAKKDDYDMVFDAGWIYLNDFAKKEYYYNLADYFKAGSKYQGLVNSFQESYINSNLFNNGVYGVPLTETFGEISVAYIRKDWRIECSLDNTWTKPTSIATSSVTCDNLSDGIDNFDELEYYLYWIKENKPEATPILSNKDATWGAWDIINTRDLPSKSAQDFVNNGIKTDIKLSPTVTAKAYIKNGQVIAATVTDENPNSENGLSAFPAGFNETDSAWQEQYTLARRWAEDGIISPNVLNTSDADAQFRSGIGGCVVQTINNFNAVESQLKSVDPNAELEIYVNNIALREKRAGYAQTDFKAWNFLCIPKTVSEGKKDLCMKFLNWIFESREHHDLFQYGIKGVHWDEAKDASGNYIEGTVVNSLENPYTFPAYELTWNPNYIRVTYASDPKVMEYVEYMYDINRYVAIPYSEFQFDYARTSELSTAFSNGDIAENYSEGPSYYLGQVSDPINKWKAELTSRYENQALQSALKVIKDELIYQLQEYIDSL